MEPTRGRRAGDQPLPSKGKAEVKPLLQKEFNEHAERRYALGIERYGRPLETFNGRDAGLDCFEELYDAMIYLKQLRLEHTITLAENVIFNQYLQQHNLVADFEKYKKGFIEEVRHNHEQSTLRRD